MIGDRDLDILAARNAGIHSCYYADGGKPSAIAEYSVSSHGELYKILGILVSDD